MDGQDLGEQLWEKSQSFAGDGSSTNRRPAVAAIPDDEMVEMDYDHAVKLGGYHGATQASVARIPTSTPVASASAATRPRPPATSPRSLPFQFWYISTERTRVRRKVDAEAKIDSGLPSSLGAKIEYHYLQANHAHAVHVLKATAVPDASGMMIGFMDDRHAPEQCPGVNAVELELGSKKSQAPAATSSVSHTPLSKATVQHSQAITKQRTSSTSQTTTSAVAATPIMPPPLPRKPPMTPSDSLKAAIALNCTLPDIPALPKNMSLTCEDDDAPAATVTASRTDITWQGPAIRLPQGRFEIQMLLDSRETRSRKDRTFFLDELRRLRVPCQSRALDVADVMWVAVPTADSYDMDELKYERRKQMFRQNDQQQLGLEDAPLDAGNLDGAQDIALDFLVERKRLDDLVGSIKEGRFQEQKVGLD